MLYNSIDDYKMLDNYLGNISHYNEKITLKSINKYEMDNISSQGYVVYGGVAKAILFKNLDSILLEDKKVIK